VKDLAVVCASQIRRKALDGSAAVLEPVDVERPLVAEPEPVSLDDETVTSQPTSQETAIREEVIDFPKEIGSPHWTISATGSVNRRKCGAMTMSSS
jgi:hypothetical protein